MLKCLFYDLILKSKELHDMNNYANYIHKTSICKLTINYNFKQLF